MESHLGDVPYWEVEFDARGVPRQGGNLPETTATAGLRELFVFSHGWNSSFGGARDLYSTMFGLIAGMLSAEQRANAGFVGVLWPALLFPEDAPADTGPPVPRSSATHDLGALASPQPTGEMSTGADLAKSLAPAFPNQEERLEQIGQLLDRQPQDRDRLLEFLRLARGLVTTSSNAPEDAGEAAVLSAPPGRVFDAMAALAPVDGGSEQAFNPFGRMWRGAREALRVLSYYEMKERAGVVGRDGLGPLLGQLAHTIPGVRVHLLGHSFGARLVSFALGGLPPERRGANSPVKSLYLLQGAFSHFAFAPRAPVRDGAGVLADCADRVDGPLVCTFSEADRAVGWWYPNASRLAWQGAELVDRINYRWGAMGYDGYQQSGAQTVTMAQQGTDYGFQPGMFYRLDANDVIKRNLSWFAQAHCDIRHPEVAWAAASAARSLCR
ncbi:serine/threonine protein kinase [Saccharopolyspora elongata]|uniref:Serine/threonine protein kinase n=1 Tax=Saccharopolyspora elongata TaxID=2530387 RepID=A0A4R4YLB2_9PSEU|nr:serine/threonine protein kinase [Saccharopolyspora elongata]TDD44242.1 serine/threonine protein kinase [Saccharopolyspora elongata]